MAVVPIITQGQPANPAFNREALRAAMDTVERVRAASAQAVRIFSSPTSGHIDLTSRAIEAIASIRSPVLLAGGTVELQERALRIIWEKRLVNLFEFPGLRPASIREIKQWIQNPANQTQLDTVRELDLSHLGLEVIPQELSLFRHLTVLDLGFNRITMIPSSLICSSVEFLLLNNNKISSLSSVTMDFILREEDILPRIASLRLDHNSIHHLNVSFLKLITARSTLTSIDLSWNRIHSYGSGEELIEMHRRGVIVKIEGTGLNFDEIQEHLTLSQGLELPRPTHPSPHEDFVRADSRQRQEEVSSEPIRTFHTTYPSSVRDLLGFLHILGTESAVSESWENPRNPEDEAFQIIWEQRLANLLEYQGARPTHLNELGRWLNDPSTEAQRNSILNLDLSGLGLEVIPNQLSHFRRIQVLNLSRNRLSHIPKFITGLPDLRVLNLSHNEFISSNEFDMRRQVAHPLGIKIFPQLRSLNLEHNRIECLTARFVNFLLRRPQLKEIRLGNNPIQIFETGTVLLSLRATRVFHGIDWGAIGPRAAPQPSPQPESQNVDSHRRENFFLRAVGEAIFEGPPRRSPEHPAPQIQPAFNPFDFGASVERANNARHAAALRDNNDGGHYLEDVIREHLQTLSEMEKANFKEKIDCSDIEIFSLIPFLALRKAVSSFERLTKENTPHFMHKYLKSLCLIQQHWQRLGRQPGDQEVQRALGPITIALSRDAACIASIQMALALFRWQNKV